ncbi:MAG: ABC transporter permease, partial [Planctomycetia bacterium]
MSHTGLLFLLWRTHLVRSFAPRRVWMLALLALLPALIAGILSLAARRVTSPEAVTNLAWFLQVQLVVPLVSLLAGIGVLAREIEDRTLTYLFTRPLSRVAVFLGRAAGALSVALLLNVLGALALLVAASG